MVKYTTFLHTIFFTTFHFFYTEIFRTTISAMIMKEHQNVKLKRSNIASMFIYIFLLFHEFIWD